MAAPPPEPKIEEIVTPEIIQAILKNYKRPDLELIDFEGESATKAGDNFSSLLYAVKLNFKSKSGGTEVLPVILKVLPKNEMRMKMIKDGNIFVRDVNMYDKVLPAMKQFQWEGGISEERIFAPWPICFGCKTDGETDFIVMEDLKAQGFKMANRQAGLDFDHCKLVMEYIARFHAISYGMFEGSFDRIIKKYPYLVEHMFNEEKVPPMLKEMFKGGYQQSAAMLKGVGEEKGAHLVSNIISEKYFDIMYNLVGAKVEQAVITHGDCWINNFLFRYDEETNKPVELKFVDFQQK